MRIEKLLALAFLALTGCKNSYQAYSDDDLLKKARSLRLEQRYQFYLEVYNETYPHRTVIAKEIALDGDIAWSYTLNQAETGDYYGGLIPALPVLQAFGRKCNDREYADLVATAKKTASGVQELQTALGRIRIACDRISGSTWLDYKKAFDSSPGR